MVRPLRIEYEGAWYHITSRGNGRRDIFCNDKDREHFLKVLSEISVAAHVEVHSYVLMNNHFHLLLHTPAGNLQRFMQRLNTAYTMYFNRRHRNCGHVLQGRYKGLLVEADEYLLHLSRYIHLNPVKIQKYGKLLPEEKQKLLYDYRWSSLLGYRGDRATETWVHHEAVLGYRGGEGKEARKRYEQFVLDGVGADLSDIYKSVKGQVILGGENFLKWVQEHFLDADKANPKDYLRLNELRREIPVDEIIQKTADAYQVTQTELLKKRSAHAEARQVAIELSYRCNAGRKSMRELGKLFGGIGGDAVLQTHKRVLQKAATDKALQQRISKIADLLAIQ
jgi:putative transposase